MTKRLKTYDDVARAAGLDDETTSIYCKYMRTRWGDEEALQCQTGYAMEWARRFAEGIEYDASDAEGQVLLACLAHAECQEEAP